MTHFKSKNIILWRHADAEIVQSGQDDAARKLTAKGLEQAAQMERWLKKKMPKQTRVFTSPALRSVQTAQNLPHKIETLYDLRPDATVAEVMQVLEKYGDVECVMLVGHQPWLGQLVGQLLELDDVTFNIRKGAVWWLRLGSREVSQYQIHTVQTTHLL
ncbi:MAG: phosphohistidine phosphatase SixA [Methylophilus sp.]|jgi:phosphohistidine phosphatase